MFFLKLTVTLSMANKFEIKIVKEANGNIVHLNKMSLQASQSLVKIIEGINKIIEAENDPSINVKLVEGCVGVEIEAPIAKMNTIQSEVKKVLNKESRNIPYLEALREIQTVIKANGITYGEINWTIYGVKKTAFYDNLLIFMIIIWIISKFIFIPTY